MVRHCYYSKVQGSRLMKGGGTSGTLKDPHIYFSALQREDILNMMISTEDRVSYLLKCGL